MTITTKSAQLVLLLAPLILASAPPAAADTIFPFCRSGGGDVGIGTGACYFSTFEQCRTSLAGFGTCFANPAYVPPAPATAPTQRRAKRG